MEKSTEERLRDLQMRGGIPDGSASPQAVDPRETGVQPVQNAAAAEQEKPFDIDAYGEKVDRMVQGQIEGDLNPGGIRRTMASPFFTDGLVTGVTMGDDHDYDSMGTAGTIDQAWVDDLRGERQGGFQQFMNGFGKFGTTAVSTFVSGTAGFVYGGYKAITEGDAQYLWDNSITNAMADFQDWAEEVMPNYRTNEQANAAWYELENLASMNFLGDVLLKNMGFTVGAIASGGLWSKLLKGGFFAYHLYKVHKSLPGILSTLVGGGISALTESSVEGVHAKREWYEQHELDASLKYWEGLKDLEESFDRGEISADAYTAGKTALETTRQEDQKALAQAAVSAGNYATLLNLPITMLTNVITFGKFFRNSEMLDNPVTEYIRKSGLRKYEAVGEPTRAGAYARAFVDQLGEGVQEISQAAVSNAAKGYATDFLDVMFRSDNDDEAYDQVASIYNHLLDEGVNTLTEADAWQEFFVGFLTPMFLPRFSRTVGPDGKKHISVEFGGILGANREYKANLANYEKAKSLVEKANTMIGNKKEFDLRTLLAANQIHLQHIKNEAMLKGDEMTYMLANTQQLLEEFDVFRQMGRLSDYENYVEESFKDGENDLDAASDMTTVRNEATGELAGPFIEAGSKLAATLAGRERMKTILKDDKEEIQHTLKSYKKALTDFKAYGIRKGWSYSDAELSKMSFLKAHLDSWGRRAGKDASSLLNNVTGFSKNEDLVAEINKHLDNKIKESEDALTKANKDWEREAKALEDKKAWYKIEGQEINATIKESQERLKVAKEKQAEAAKKLEEVKETKEKAAEAAQKLADIEGKYDAKRQEYRKKMRASKDPEEKAKIDHEWKNSYADEDKEKNAVKEQLKSLGIKLKKNYTKDEMAAEKSVKNADSEVSEIQKEIEEAAKENEEAAKAIADLDSKVRKLYEEMRKHTIAKQKLAENREGRKKDGYIEDLSPEALKLYKDYMETGKIDESVKGLTVDDIEGLLFEINGLHDVIEYLKKNHKPTESRDDLAKDGVLTAKKFQKHLPLIEQIYDTATEADRNSESYLAVRRLAYLGPIIESYEKVLDDMLNKRTSLEDEQKKRNDKKAEKMRQKKIEKLKEILAKSSSASNFWVNFEAEKDGGFFRGVNLSEEELPELLPECAGVGPADTLMEIMKFKDALDRASAEEGSFAPEEAKKEVARRIEKAYKSADSLQDMTNINNPIYKEKGEGVTNTDDMIADNILNKAVAEVDTLLQYRELFTSGEMDTSSATVTSSGNMADSSSSNDVQPSEDEVKNEEKREGTQLHSSGPKSYMYPTIPEYVKDKDGNMVRFKDAKPEYSELYDYLEEKGAFEAANQRMIKAGDSIKFGIDHELEARLKKALGDKYTGPTIVMVMAESGQVVGALPSSNTARKEVQGLAALFDSVTEADMQGDTGITYLKKSDGTEITSEVDRMMNGQVPSTKDGKLRNIQSNELDGDNVAVAVYNSSSPSRYFKNLATSSRAYDLVDGRVYLLVKNATGQYTPHSMYVNPYKGEAIPRELRDAINAVFSNISDKEAVEKNLKELLVSGGALQSYFFTRDLGFFIEEEGGSTYLRIVKSLKTATGEAATKTSASGNQVKDRIVKEIALSSGMNMAKALQDVFKELGVTRNIPKTATADMINELADAGYLSTTKGDLSPKNCWFTVKPLTADLDMTDAVYPESWKTTVATPKAGSSSSPATAPDTQNSSVSITGIPVDMSDGTAMQRYYVDLKTEQAYDSKGAPVPDNFPKKAELLAAATLNFLYGSNKDGFLMRDNIAYYKGQIFDRNANKFLSGTEFQRMSEEFIKEYGDMVNPRTTLPSTEMGATEAVNNILKRSRENVIRLANGRPDYGPDHKYYHIKEEDGKIHQYERVHSVIPAQYPNGGNSNTSGGALIFGNFIDSAIRAYETTGKWTVPPDVTIAENMKDKWVAFQKAYESWSSNIRASGGKVHAEGVVLYYKGIDPTTKAEKRVAGEVDLYIEYPPGSVKYPKGGVEIVDIKTTWNRFWDNLGGLSKSFTEKSGNQVISTQEMYTNQQSMYSYLHYLAGAGHASALSLLPVNARYSKGEKKETIIVTSKGYKEDDDYKHSLTLDKHVPITYNTKIENTIAPMPEAAPQSSPKPSSPGTASTPPSGSPQQNQYKSIENALKAIGGEDLWEAYAGCDDTAPIKTSYRGASIDPSVGSRSIGASIMREAITKGTINNANINALFSAGVPKVQGVSKENLFKLFKEAISKNNWIKDSKTADYKDYDNLVELIFNSIILGEDASVLPEGLKSIMKNINNGYTYSETLLLIRDNANKEYGSSTDLTPYNRAKAIGWFVNLDMFKVIERYAGAVRATYPNNIVTDTPAASSSSPAPQSPPSTPNASNPAPQTPQTPQASQGSTPTDTAGKLATWSERRVVYRGMPFKSVSHAYQTWKSGAFDPEAWKTGNKGEKIPTTSKEANKATNLNEMVAIYTEMFKQHKDIVQEITAAGGMTFLQNLSAGVGSSSFWIAQGNLKNAIITAYSNVTSGVSAAQQSAPKPPAPASPPATPPASNKPQPTPPPTQLEKINPFDDNTEEAYINDNLRTALKNVAMWPDETPQKYRAFYQGLVIKGSLDDPNVEVTLKPPYDDLFGIDAYGNATDAEGIMKFDGSGLPMFRRTNGKGKPGRLKEELIWLNRVLPQMTNEERLRIVEGLIEVNNKGEKAWGMFKKGMITLSNKAARGTVYHEAFHAVFGMYLSSSERAEIMKEARKRWGNKSTHELEEIMAEEFREYTETREDKGLGAAILRFFKDLFNMLFPGAGNVYFFTSLYEKINNGDFANVAEIVSKEAGKSASASDMTTAFMSGIVPAGVVDSYNSGAAVSAMSRVLDRFGLNSTDFSTYNSESALLDSALKVATAPRMKLDKHTEEEMYAVAYLMQKSPSLIALLKSGRYEGISNRRLDALGLMEYGDKNLVMRAVAADLAKAMDSLHKGKNTDPEASAVIAEFLSRIDSSTRADMLAARQAIGNAVWSSNVSELAADIEDSKRKPVRVNSVTDYSNSGAGIGSAPLALKALYALSNDGMAAGGRLSVDMLGLSPYTGYGSTDSVTVLAGENGAAKARKTLEDAGYHPYEAIREGGSVYFIISKGGITESKPDKSGLIEITDGKGKVVGYRAGSTVIAASAGIGMVEVQEKSPSSIVKTAVSGKVMNIADWRDSVSGDTDEMHPVTSSSHTATDLKSRNRSVLRKLANATVIWGPFFSISEVASHKPDVINVDSEIREALEAAYIASHKAGQLNKSELEYHMNQWIERSRNSAEFQNTLYKIWSSVRDRHTGEVIFTSNTDLLSLAVNDFDAVIGTVHSVPHHAFVRDDLQSREDLEIKSKMRNVPADKLVYSERAFSVGSKSNDKQCWHNLTEDFKEYLKMRGISREQWESYSGIEREMIERCF